MSEVTEVRVEIVVDGKRRAAIFLRREKIDEIMRAEESLGDFLQAMAHADTPLSQSD